MEEWRGRGVAREACEAIDAIDKREREAGRRKPRTANRHPQPPASVFNFILYYYFYLYIYTTVYTRYTLVT